MTQKDIKNRNLYITTPIYYVNDSPHLGHAYTTLACDIYARFARLDGRNVRLLTGTDEHGQKIAKSAELKNVTPKELCDDVSTRFKALVDVSVIGEADKAWGGNLLNITNDDFIRTTEDRHYKACEVIWNKMKANGHIYLNKYAGWYSVRDEAYYGEEELVNGKAPTGADVEWIEEESYFFDLSKWQDKLLEFYENHPDFVYPKSRYNEVISFVKGGLNDLSISRTKITWGVPVPADEGEKNKGHVMYVWVDALTNYLTSLGFPDENAENYKNFWSENNEKIHVVGKDILRFHAVYWPAFLMAANLPVQDRVIAHGWWTVEGEKMSKSLGNVIAPQDLVENFGLEQTRYFLFKAMPFGNDGDLSRERLIETVNADLANNIGNLAQRTLSMINKNCDGKVPACLDRSQLDQILNICIFQKQECESSEFKSTFELFEKFLFLHYLSRIASVASSLNQYMDTNAPWTLRKEGKLEEMGNVLYNIIEGVRHIAIMLQPFCPNACAKLLDQLGVPANERNFANLTEEFALKAGTTLPAPQGVFPRLEVKKD